MKNRKLNDGRVCKKQSGSLAPHSSRGIIDALQIWKQMEDLVVPRLRLNLVERVVYYHLLRHSRLEGRLQLRFSILWLTRGIRLSAAPIRAAVRSLVEKGALRGRCPLA